MRLDDIEIIKQNDDIREMLLYLHHEIEKIFESNLVGLYLFGSLVYGGFDKGRSDIDLVAILKNPASADELEQVKTMHVKFGEKYPEWADRVECSYTPKNMLQEILPPAEPRPYFGGGKFYDLAGYENEWLINQHCLYHDSIALVGPEYKTLIKEPSTKDMQRARVRDLFEEWKPKIEHSEYLDDPHQQSYAILHVCRILYTIFTGKLASKQKSAEWVKENLGWKDLINQAENWKYRDTMDNKEEAINFIRFAVDEVKKVRNKFEC